MRKSRILLLILPSFIFLSSTWVNPAPNTGEEDYYFRLKKSWQHMQNVFEKINMHYVDEIDPYPLVKAGIDGMLEKLDPYTVFIEEDGERRLRMITTGKYGGLGMEIGMKNDKVTVISPMENSPALRAGVHAGDIITEIDGQKVDKINIDKISGLLRGEIGTSVNLVLERAGLANPIEMTLTRAEIVIEDVNYAGFIAPGVAYISLSGFTDKAEDEMRRAIRELREQGKIEQMILDLRGNPGGLLDAAVDIVNLFVDKGETVVYTKGFREGEIKFKTQKEPLLPDVELAVLVDRGSASASEIVAGALQDIDRAVIIGEETFGKGLVQKVYNIDKNSDSKVKITTAKYYIPSGRSIQKKNYSQNNDVIVVLDGDSTFKHVPFFTKNKRQVYDHGGIQPDIAVADDSLDYVLLELIRKNCIFNFAVQYYQNNPEMSGDIIVDEDVFSQFKKYLDDDGFVFNPEGTREIERLKQVISGKQNSAELLKLVNDLEIKLAGEKGSYLDESKEQLKKYIKLELAEKYLGRKGRTKYAIDQDGQIAKAMEVLKNQAEYNKILAVN